MQKKILFRFCNPVILTFLQDNCMLIRLFIYLVYQVHKVLADKETGRGEGSLKISVKQFYSKSITLVGMFHNIQNYGWFTIRNVLL